MNFTQFTQDIAYIASLSDLPNQNEGLTATQLKNKFDQAGLDIQNYLNNTFISELESITDGSSGADKIGATSITDLNGNTVQALLESLKNFIDTNFYTSANLDGGQLDNRYYTEVELDGGQLDNRYYTETEIDALETDLAGAGRTTETIKQNSDDIDSLETADTQNVKITGNQTVDGVKTFTSSPIVPSPSIDSETSTKKYVDDTVADAVLGSLPDNSIENIKLDQDIKIGSLANLTTSDKSNVVTAINELDTNINNITTKNIKLESQTINTSVEIGDIVLFDGEEWITSNNGIGIYEGNNIVILSGIVTLTGLTAEENYYIQSDGTISTIFQTDAYCGYALSTTELVFKIDNSYRNTQPPDSVSNLAVDSVGSANGDEVTLSWDNPIDEDFDGVRITYKTGSYPTSPTDGTIVDPANSPQTITGLTTDTQYYFNVYSYDVAGNYASPEQITATPTSVLEVGLEWNQTTDSYTRLGDAVGLDVTNKGTDGVKTSDFDSVYPYSDMKLCNVADNGTVNAYYGDAGFVFDGSNGQVMVEIPKFYYKAELDITSDRIFRRWICETDIDGTYSVAPSHVVGGVEKDYIYIGAKLAYNNGGTLESKSGVTPTGSQTISTFRTQAENRGSGWTQLGAMEVFMVWQFLFPIEYGTFKSQESLGQDWTGESAVTNTGSMDSYGEDSYGVVSDGLSSASYRGIENPWGNVRQFVDGLIIKDDGYYLEDDYTNYNDTGSGYTNVGITPITADGYIDNLEFDTTFDYLGFAKSVNGSSSTYIPDYQYSHDTSEVNIATFGGFWARGSFAGAFHWLLSYVASISYSSIGARLVYKG